MNNHTELSPDALRILKTIHERGLIVLMSFRVPYPRYADDDTEFPREDWAVVVRELRHIKREIEYVDNLLGGMIEFECNVWVSDYLTDTRIDRDAETEEFKGLLHRYELTDYARQLIGVQS